jgi:shikimate kinase
MGAGKSTVGRELAARMNFRFLDMDNLIEKREKKSISEIFRIKGEDHFRDVEHEVLKAISGYDENLVVSTGGGAPCYLDNMDILNATGITVYLKLDPEDLYARLKYSYLKKRPLLKDKTSKELMSFIVEKLRERELYYHRSKIIYPGKTVDIRDLERKILALMTEPDASVS